MARVIIIAHVTRANIAALMALALAGNRGDRILEPDTHPITMPDFPQPITCKVDHAHARPRGKGARRRERWRRWS